MQISPQPCLPQTRQASFDLIDCICIKDCDILLFQVYVESAVLRQVTECTECSKELKLRLLHVLMNAMGNTAHYANVFFTFSASQTADIELITTVGMIILIIEDILMMCFAGVSVHAVGVCVSSSI